MHYGAFAGDTLLFLTPIDPHEALVTHSLTSTFILSIQLWTRIFVIFPPMNGTFYWFLIIVFN